MISRTRVALLAAVLAAGVVVAFAATGSPPGSKPSRPTTLPTSGKTPTLPPTCLQPLPVVATPSWYPKDLPMPAGSTVGDVPAAQAGLRRVVFTANASLRDFVKHALTVWPANGWRLGRGESEPGEAEDNFLKEGNRYGLFRAQSVFCDQSKTWVLIVMTDPSTASPKPSTS
jgi:hypothetical protein